MPLHHSHHSYHFRMGQRGVAGGCVRTSCLVARLNLQRLWYVASALEFVFLQVHSLVCVLLRRAFALHSYSADVLAALFHTGGCDTQFFSTVSLLSISSHLSLKVFSL